MHLPDRTDLIIVEFDTEDPQSVVSVWTRVFLCPAFLILLLLQRFIYIGFDRSSGPITTIETRPACRHPSWSLFTPDSE